MNILRAQRDWIKKTRIRTKWNNVFGVKLGKGEMLIIGFIYSLESEFGGCVLNDDQLSQTLSIHKTMIQRDLRALVKKGILQIDYGDGKGERCIIPQGATFLQAYKVLNTKKENKNKEKKIKKKSYQKKKEKKEIKRKKDIEEGKDPILELFKDELPEGHKKRRDLFKMIEEFHLFRKQLGFPLKKQSAKIIANKFKRFSPDICLHSLELSIMNGWRGVFPESVDERDLQGGCHPQDTPTDLLDDFLHDHQRFVSKRKVLEKDILPTLLNLVSSLSDLKQLACVRNLLLMLHEVDEEQRETGAHEISVLPTSTRLVQDFIEFLVESKTEWLDNVNEKMFKKDSKIFQQFVISQARRVWNERNPITGAWVN